MNPRRVAFVAAVAAAVFAIGYRLESRNDALRDRLKAGRDAVETAEAELTALREERDRLRQLVAARDAAERPRTAAVGGETATR
ncbi:MAG: hypothetical protein AAF532_01330 [Planctomycetota bacterium]